MKNLMIARLGVTLCLLVGSSAYAGGGVAHEPAHIDSIGQITMCTGTITKNGKAYHAQLALLADFNQYYCSGKSGADGLVVFKGDLDGMIIGHWDLQFPDNDYVFHSHESASADHDEHDCRSGSCAPNLYDFSKLSVRFIYNAKSDTLAAELSGPRLSATQFSCVSDASSGRQCTDPDRE